MFFSVSMVKKIGKTESQSHIYLEKVSLGNNSITYSLSTLPSYTVFVLYQVYIFKNVSAPYGCGEVAKTVKQTFWAGAQSTMQETTSNLLRALLKRDKNVNVKGIVFICYLPLVQSYFDENKTHFSLVNFRRL